MATIKYLMEQFEINDVPDNLINIWSYNDVNHGKNCRKCCIRSDICEKTLKRQWNSDWGEFDFVILKIKENDKTFIDISGFSSMTKWEIIDILVQKNI